MGNVPILHTREPAVGLARLFLLHDGLAFSAVDLNLLCHLLV